MREGGKEKQGDPLGDVAIFWVVGRETGQSLGQVTKKFRSLRVLVRVSE